MVVVPLYIEGGKAVFMEEGNPWREAWARLKDRSPLVPLLLPTGEAKCYLSAAQALSKDPAALQALAAATRPPA